MTISNEKKVDVALKYLELARAEILYRVKSTNDTLIVYAGAVGAIAAWVYKSYHDQQEGSLPNGPALSIPPSTLSAGLVVSFCPRLQVGSYFTTKGWLPRSQSTSGTN